MLSLGFVKAGTILSVPFYTVDQTGAPVTITTASPTFRVRNLYRAADANPTTIQLTFLKDVAGVTGYHVVRFQVPGVGSASWDAPGDYALTIEGAVIAGVTCTAVLAMFRSAPAQGAAVQWGVGIDAASPTTFTLSSASGTADGGIGGIGQNDNQRLLVAAGDYLVILSRSGYAPDVRLITTYDPTTGTGTVAPAFSATPPVGAGVGWTVLMGPATAPLAAADLDATAITAIQAGLATAAGVAGVQADTDNIQTRIPAALVGGRRDSSVGAVAAASITGAGLDATAIAAIQAGLATAAAVAAVQADTDNLQTRVPAALVGGRMDANVGTATAAALTGAAFDATAVAAVQAGLATAAAVAAVQADTDNLQTRVPAALVGGKMDSTAISNGILSLADSVEPGLTLVQALRLILAYCAGLTSGFQGQTPAFKSVDLSGTSVVGTKTRISGTLSTAGERTGATVDVSPI